MPARVREEDPLTLALAPPPNETPEAREARLLAERRAKEISDAIDADINRERLALKKAPKPVKILLLGQSESGKSTTLKNFQLLESPKAFNAERASWRTVIQLNIVRSIRFILDALGPDNGSGNGSPRSSAVNAMAEQRQHTSPCSPPSKSMSTSLSSPPSSHHSSTSPLHPPVGHLRKSTSASSFTSASSLASQDQLPLSPELRLLRIRLSPLVQVEEALLRRLNPEGAVLLRDEGAVPVGPTPDSNGVHALAHEKAPRDLAVNSSAWRGVVKRLLPGTATESNGLAIGKGPGVIDFDDPRDCGALIHACAPDMIRLWNDPAVKEFLVRKKLRLEETSGFFLDALERVTQLRYVPTDEDILRARIKTLGITEYRFTMTCTGHAVSHDWRVFDVGGQRSLRAAWAPFMDDINAVIFLAPISCFDQVLAEDPRVNRLEDSVLLWRSIVSNPLLKGTNLVLFLNKCDILKAKLMAGVRLADYIVSYGDRPNDFESASNYLKKKFSRIQKEMSVEPRGFFCHFTSVTDIAATKLILTNVQDFVLRQHLVHSQLIA